MRGALNLLEDIETSFLPEEKPDTSIARFSTQPRLLTDRELAAKVGDSSKQLSLDLK
jgi:hypothetical protein